MDHTFDLEERIAYYMMLCKDSNAILFDDINEVSKLIEEEIEYLKQLDRPKVLCHIDPVESNFVKLYDGSLRLLDWEYAGMSDPILDIAMHAIYSGHQETRILELIEIYLERKPTKQETKILYMYVSLSGYLWALWAQFKQARGESFGSYALDQYHYAHKYARLALAMED
ncbi:phosphotransferase family protein [Erysipelothrix piscisicarius]|uniref:phosphotransferase family protein n=1 Tax=Erysipelothrix piscisicarius TaxID=2485784 RepID=UPI002F92B5C7